MPTANSDQTGRSSFQLSFNVRFPIKIMTDCDYQIFRFVSCFQCDNVKFVWISDGIFFLDTRI